VPKALCSLELVGIKEGGLNYCISASYLLLLVGEKNSIRNLDKYVILSFSKLPNIYLQMPIEEMTKREKRGRGLKKNRCDVVH